jgi:hypothetical protein
MIVKLLNHKQGMFSVFGEDRKKLFQDITKDDRIVDPIEIFKTHVLEVKAEEDEDNEMIQVRFTFSTNAIDRDNERIVQSGWDLKNYLKNPVVLWMHDGGFLTESRPAIGYTKDLTIDNSLKGTVVFAPKKVDHFSWSIGKKLQLGILRAGSVGFRPIEWKWIDSEDDDAELEFVRQELGEFSIVNLPANPEALVQYSDSEEQELKHLEERLDEIEQKTKTWEEFFQSNSIEVKESWEDFFNRKSTVEEEGASV